jgi:hypothetical protein
MKQTITNDIALELSRLRATAAAPQGGLRILDEMELGWISGGDPGPNYDNSTPPPGP